MQSAPSVSYPVGRSAFQAGLLVSLGLATAATGACYLVTANFSANPAWSAVGTLLGAMGWLCWVVLARWSWSKSPVGLLRWQPVRGIEQTMASGWSWAEGLQTEQVALNGLERVLDLQDRVLLRFRLPGSGQRWVWAERSGLPARWTDFRRALMSGHL